jgi:hypothetical protein
MAAFVQVGGNVTSAIIASMANPLITSGSLIVGLPTPCSRICLIVNCLGPVSGTSIQFSLFEVDPQDQMTLLTDREGGTTGVQSTVIQAVGVDTSAQITNACSTWFQVAWNVQGGFGASFPCNVTLVGKI